MKDWPHPSDPPLNERALRIEAWLIGVPYALGLLSLAACAARYLFR